MAAIQMCVGMGAVWRVAFRGVELCYQDPISDIGAPMLSY